MKKWILILLIVLMGCSHSVIENKTILSINENTVLTAPEDYDRDAHDSFKDEIVEMEISEDVVIYDSFKQIIVHEDGKEEVNETTRELTKEEFVDLFEYGSVTAYLEIENDVIKKITVWGEVRIEE